MSTITAEQVRSAFSYDPETGLCFWLNRPDLPLKWNRRWAGKQISPASPGYIYVRVNYTKYLLHRLIWLWVTGAFPPSGFDIDHINCIKTDNHWTNLRVATRSENKANVAKPRTNTSGFKGVRYRSDRSYWEARLKIKGKEKHLGCFDTPEEAHAAYDVAAQQHFGEFARV